MNAERRRRLDELTPNARIAETTLRMIETANRKLPERGSVKVGGVPMQRTPAAEIQYLRDRVAQLRESESK